MNELKNYARKLACYFTAASLSLVANDAFCFSENQTNTLSSSANLRPETGNVVSMIMGLLFVLFVIFIIAWLAKKFNLTPASSDHFKLVSSMSLGGRERIVIIEIQGEQHAVGVTNQSVNHLFKLDKSIDTSVKPLTDNHLVNKINKLFGYQAPEQSQTLKPLNTNSAPQAKDVK